MTIPALSPCPPANRTLRETDGTPLPIDGWHLRQPLQTHGLWIASAPGLYAAVCCRQLTRHAVRRLVTHPRGYGAIVRLRICSPASSNR
jgi:hypothetical protein